MFLLRMGTDEPGRGVRGVALMARCRMSKHHRLLALWAEPFGWSWALSGSGHIKWTHPEVPGFVATPHTPRIEDSRKPKQKMRAAFLAATGRVMESAGA